MQNHSERETWIQHSVLGKVSEHKFIVKSGCLKHYLTWSQIRCLFKQRKLLPAEDNLSRYSIIKRRGIPKLTEWFLRMPFKSHQKSKTVVHCLKVVSTSSVLECRDRYQRKICPGSERKSI